MQEATENQSRKLNVQNVPRMTSRASNGEWLHRAALHANQFDYGVHIPVAATPLPSPDRNCRRESSSSALRSAAIHCENLTCDPARLIAREEDRSSRNILRSTQSTRVHAFQKALLSFRSQAFPNLAGRGA